MYGRDGVIEMSSKTSSPFTEDWLPVKSITNGMIELNDKTRVTGVKIRPKNIFIMDKLSQDNIIAALKTFYDTIDFEFWLISNDRPVDISSYLTTLQIRYNQENDPFRKKLLIQDIEKANEFMRDEVIDIEYFILFKDKNPDMLLKKLRNVILGLSNCGLDSSQVFNDDLRMLLDSFFNGGKSTTNKVVLPSE